MLQLLLIASNYSMFDKLGKLKSSSEKKEVTEVFSLKHEGQDYLHVVNYQNSGFAIVSASKKEFPILAYSDNGEFILDENMPSDLAMWLEATMENIKIIHEKNLTPPSAVNKEWKKYSTLGDNNSTTKAFEDPYDPDDCTMQLTQRGPYLSTSWSQGCGYNDFCPLISGGPCGRSQVGCVAVAMGQIIRYHEYPSIYDYSLMEDSYATSETALLLSDCGVAINMDYGATESGADGGRIDNVLKDVFGYSSASDGTYALNSYNTVTSNLNQGWPLVLMGCREKNSIFGITLGYEKCHAWVCDGYRSSYFPCSGSTHLQFHMNWGWSPTYNGWFGFNTWAVTMSNGTVRNYKYSNEYIFNIHP